MIFVSWIAKRVSTFFGFIEDGIAFVSLLAILILSVSGILGRVFFHWSIPDLSALITHATFLLACAGASVAGREGRRLGIYDPSRPRGLLSAAAAALRVAVSTAVLSALTVTSIAMVIHSFDPSARVSIFPQRLVAAALPLSFFAILFRSYGREQRGHPLSFFVGFCIGLFASSQAAESIFVAASIDVHPFISKLASIWASRESTLFLPGLALLAVAGVSGTPLFLVFAGIAYLSFAFTEGHVEVVSLRAYSMLTGDVIPAIPLFTLAGYILADSGAGKRLFTLLRSLLCWMRGGSAIAVLIVAAFFTTFTGASGVSILALGSMLAAGLKDSGYAEEQAEGFLASSGAIGILFPPSLAVIVYGFVAKVSIKDLFVGGSIPGLLFLAAMMAAGVVGDWQPKRARFSLKEVGSALGASAGELILPIVVVVGYFSGFLTLVETGAFAALYSIILVSIVRGNIALRSLFGAALKSVPVTGGVLIILAAASGLSGFLVDARVPSFLTDIVQAAVPSKWTFLLMLNAVLLVAGCFMDLFSAVLIIAPLIMPMASFYSVHPVHLGVVFLTNLSLGFLTPPVGLNLSITSFAFNTPFRRVTRIVLPYFSIQFIVLMAITFFPVLSTVFLK